MRRWWQAVAVLTIVLFLPFQAMAGVCFDLENSAGPPMELHLDLYGTSLLQGLFFSLGGALLAYCAGVPPVPLTGTAFLDPFGAVVFAMTVMAARAGCVPAMLEGRFDPGTLLGVATLVTMTGVILHTLNMRVRAACTPL
jgi:hypothetical protein